MGRGDAGDLPLNWDTWSLWLGMVDRNKTVQTPMPVLFKWYMYYTCTSLPCRVDNHCSSLFKSHVIILFERCTGHRFVRA